MIRSGAPLLFLVCLLVLGTGSGCSSSDAEKPAPQLHREAQDAQSGAKLRVQTERDEIGIADRIWVEAEWTWTGAASVTLMPPDWGEHDWTLLETVESPTTRTAEGYIGSTRWLIEPFLPGEYAIPSPVLLVQHTESPRELSIEPLTIRVEGVLPEGDTGELNPIAAPTLPDQADESIAPIWIGVLATLVLLAVLVLWIIRRATDHPETETIYTQLQRISSDNQLDREHAYQMLDRVLARLDPRLRQTSEVAELIRECQRARFASHHEPRVTPARIAQHALELLGHEGDSSKSGSTA